MSRADTDESADVSAEQYVTFLIEDECYGFSLSSVFEIIRVPDLTLVPLAPVGLRGLANLRGAVLPVVDLRQMIGLPMREADESMRIIVVDCGAKVGLVVDRVVRVQSIPMSTIEAAASAGSFFNDAMLDGVAKGCDGSEIIQLLNATELVRFHFASGIDEQRPSPSVSRQSLSNGIGEAEERDDVRQIVTLAVDGQEYGLELAEVREIVRMPQSISKVAGSRPGFIGVVNLRTSVLPLISLRTLLGLPAAGIEQTERIIVVTLDQASGDQRAIGLVVDEVREVLRFHDASVSELPSLLDQDDGVIESVCRLDGGKRIISILSAQALLGDTAWEDEICNHELADSESGEISVADEHDADDEEQFVIFEIDGQPYGASISSVQEIIRIPKSIQKIPQTPAFVEGVMNLRGSVLPVIEMRVRLKLDRIERNERQRILVLKLADTNTGFVVDSVSEVRRVGKKDIETAPSLSHDQRDLMGRIARDNTEERMIQLLEVDRLLDQSQVDAVRALG